MRIIAGEFRSRILKTLPGFDVRPTLDRLREALFNVLAPRIEGTLFIDVYAGTGAVGIEALSRGASRAIFIEYNHDAVRVIRENLHTLGLEPRAEVRRGRAASILGQLQERADIVFVDPPYRLESEYERTLAILGGNPPPLVIVQHASRFQLTESYGGLQRSRMLKQGENSLSFFVPVER
jgi:16S rRNA (guanine966-N2)-methyltransferase